jgi:hypothetical protein
MKPNRNVHVLVFLCVSAVCGLTGCSEQKAKPVKLPPAQYPSEPEMESFVDEVLSGKEPNVKALQVFYSTLDRDEQRSLEHELNFMLKVRGSSKRFYLHDDGLVCDAPPPPANRTILNDFVKALRRRRSPNMEEMNRLLVSVQMRNGDVDLERHLSELNNRLASLGKQVRWDGKELSVVTK